MINHDQENNLEDRIEIGWIHVHKNPLYFCAVHEITESEISHNMNLQSVKWYIYESMGDALETGDTALWRWYQDADIFLRGIKVRQHEYHAKGVTKRIQELHGSSGGK